MNRAEPLILASNVTRTFQVGSELINALENVNLEVYPSQFIALVGRSGSGKTTLLNLLAGLDRPTQGMVRFEGKDLSKASAEELLQIRRHKIGFVFQSFGLLPLLSAFENVELPLRIAGAPAKTRERRAWECLEMVGLEKRAKHRPYELSGGEQQRVAIARAIVHRPPIVLADEPTGELDYANATAIFGLFKEMVRQEKVTVLAATHDVALVTMADLIVQLRNGVLESQQETAGGVC